MFTNRRCSPFGGRVIIIVTALVLACVIRAGEAEKPNRIADVLPDNTILFVEVSPWAQWSEDFKKTAPAQIFADPEIRSFLDGPISRLASLYRTAGPAKAPGDAKAPEEKPGTAATAATALLGTLGSLTRGPFTVAVRYSADDAKAQKVPGVVVMLGAQDPNIENWFKTLVAGLEKQPEIKVTGLGTEFELLKIQGLSVKDYDGNKILIVSPTLDGAPKTVATVTLYKGRLIVSNDYSLCEDVMKGLTFGRVAGKRLSDSDGYKSCGLSGDEHMLAYLDIANLQKALSAVAKPAEPGATPLDEVLGRVGLKQATAVAWSLKMNGPAFESRTAIFTKGEREGMLGMLADGELSDDALRICPSGTPFAAGFRVKQDCMAGCLRSAFRGLLGAKGLEDFAVVEKDINAQAGRNFEKEINAALGGEIVVASLAGMTDAGPIEALSAMAASVSVQDKEKTEALLTDLFTRLAAKSGPDVAVKKLDLDGKTVRYFNAAAGLVSVSPAFVLADDKLLVMASDVPALRAALRVMKDKDRSLLSSDTFKAALANTGGKMGSAFSYVDWPGAYKSLFTFGTSALRMVAPTGVLTRAGIDMNLLPSANAVASHLCAGLTVARVTPNGIALASRSPLPSLEVLAPPIAAAVVVFESFRPFMVADKEKK